MKKIPIWLARFLLTLVIIPIVLGAVVWFQSRSGSCRCWIKLRAIRNSWTSRDSALARWRNASATKAEFFILSLNSFALKESLHKGPLQLSYGG